MKILTILIDVFFDFLLIFIEVVTLTYFAYMLAHLLMLAGLIDIIPKLF